MRTEIGQQHNTDDQGRPAGGHTEGIGFQIDWQNGPLMIDGERRDPNGAFVEDVIQAAIGRLEHYQESKFQCQENADAIDFLSLALGRLDDRTHAREERGVEGTHEV